jgi:hypothetical protein
MLAMKRSGAFLKIRLAVIVALLLFLKPLLIILWLISDFSVKLLGLFSCLTLQCARGANALLKKIVGATWRLQVAGKAISLRLHVMRKAATISGT